MKKQVNGFTLVELIVVILILLVLGTITFISFQGYSKEARDTKRVSDTRNMLNEVELESIKGKDLSLILSDDENKKKNNLTINKQSGVIGYQGILDYSELAENPENWEDPLTKTPYPFAYAQGTTNLTLDDGKTIEQKYNFTQMAYVSEKSGKTKIVGNYFRYDEGDSLSLFTNSLGTYITDDGADLPYNIKGDDIGENIMYKNCEAGINIDGYELTSNLQNNSTTDLKKAETKGHWQISEMTLKVRCNNGVLEKIGKAHVTGVVTYDGTMAPGILTLAEQSDSNPECDFPDIIIHSGGVAIVQLSACNAGASIAGTHEGCVGTNGSYHVDLEDCDPSRVGYHYQWMGGPGGSNGLQPIGIAINDTSITNTATAVLKGFILKASFPTGNTTDTWLGYEVCPAGYKIPSSDEWTSIVGVSWKDNTTTGGYEISSDLLLPYIGIRGGDSASLFYLDKNASYRASNVSTTTKGSAYRINITKEKTGEGRSTNIYYQPNGVRCIKDI